MSSTGSTLRAAVGRVLSLILDPTVAASFSRPGYVVHGWAFDPNDLDVDMSTRRCLITGANQGIGYEAACGLAKLGAEVVLLCRNRQRGMEAATRIVAQHGGARVEVVELDVSDLRMIQRLGPMLRERKIDVLVHNAGLLPSERILSNDGIELTMATHVVGPHLLTRQLRAAFTGDARVIWVSSGGMYTTKLSLDDWTWEKRPFDGVAAYAQTKRMQVILSEMWAEALIGKGVCVSCMHPGWADTSGVRTSLPRFHTLMRSVLRSPAEGADTVVWLAASAAASTVHGKFFLDRVARRTHYLPMTSESEAQRRALWDLCERLTAPFVDE